MDMILLEVFLKNIHLIPQDQIIQLLEEGISRNVPIEGFEMILREDYKSRDEVEGLKIFPKYHFKPQDTRKIL